jgi:hypothetical protein
MRRAGRLPDMRQSVTARDSKGAQLLLHAGVQAQGDRRQRAERKCAEDVGSIQGLARARLRLLFRQTVAAGDEDEKRRQEFPDRAPLDDQPLMRVSSNLESNHAAVSGPF